MRLCDQTKVNKFNLECVPESKTHTKTKKKKTIKRKHIVACKAKTHTEIEKKNNKKKTYCCPKVKTYTKIEKKKTNKNISLRESKTNESKVALRAREIVLKS